MPAADARFISLADALRGRLPAPDSAARASEPPPVVSQPLPVAPAADLVERSAALRDARVFRAALGDAFDAALVGLVRRLAVDVVARELRLGAADIVVLAQRLLAEWEAEEPLRLRVAETDANVVCALPVIVDSTLEAGDAILECRSGSIDARLGVRLAAVLDAVTA